MYAISNWSILWVFIASPYTSKKRKEVYTYINSFVPITFIPLNHPFVLLFYFWVQRLHSTTMLYPHVTILMIDCLNATSMMSVEVKKEWWQYRHTVHAIVSWPHPVNDHIFYVCFAQKRITTGTHLTHFNSRTIFLIMIEEYRVYGCREKNAVTWLQLITYLTHDMWNGHS